MRRILDFFQNTFLMLILIGLFALPLLVNLNLTPIVDESLAKNTTSGVPEVTNDLNMVARNKSENDVLGTQEVRYPGIRIENISLNKVFSDERVLQDTGKRYFSMIKLFPSQDDKKAESDNLYIIRNNNRNSQEIEVLIDGDNYKFRGIRLDLNIDDDSYELYDGTEFKSIPHITLGPGEEKVISINAVYGDSGFDGGILSVRINLI